MKFHDVSEKIGTKATYLVPSSYKLMIEWNLGLYVPRFYCKMEENQCIKSEICILTLNFTCKRENCYQMHIDYFHITFPLNDEMQACTPILQCTKNICFS